MLNKDQIECDAHRERPAGCVDIGVVMRMVVLLCAHAAFLPSLSRNLPPIRRSVSSHTPTPTSKTRLAVN